jgi:hypothetical protein
LFDADDEFGRALSRHVLASFIAVLLFSPGRLACEWGLLSDLMCERHETGVEQANTSAVLLDLSCQLL